MGNEAHLTREGTLRCSLNRSDRASSPPRPQDLEQPLNEDANLLPQLQQLENTLSGCTKEASKDQVFMRMGYMASELKRLATKVHKNEQRTSFLQVSEGRMGSSWCFSPFIFFPPSPSCPP